MHEDGSKGLCRLSGWAAVALLAACGAARAGDAEADLKALLERQAKIIEEQGRQLDELKKRVEALSSPAGAPAEGAKDDKPAPDRGAVEKMVADYLKEQDRKKKEADDKSKKEADEKKRQEEVDGKVVGSDLNLTAKWNHGLWVENADRSFRVHVGGRTQIDAVWVKAGDNVQFGRNGIGRYDDAVNFRRARLAVEGTLWEVFDFNCEYDFLNTFNTEPAAASAIVGDTPVPTDLWGQISHLPYVGNFRVGNQKPPIAFEHLTSSRYLNFLERSLAFDAFVEDQDNGFRPGVLLFNWAENERATWALGVFKNNRSIFGWNVGDGEADVTGRVTCLPWYEHEGRCLLHLGVAASHKDTDDEQDRLRARPMLRNGPAVLHNVIAEIRALADSRDMVVPELVLNLGPFTLQTEYYAVWLHDAVIPITPAAARFNRGTMFLHGGYVEALYFLTGEHRRYDTRYPRFDRVIPNENFWWVRADGGGRSVGRGAWQVAARYSYLDLNDNGVEGGVIHDLSLGLNWFLNPNAKVQWNYTIAHRDGPGNTADGTIQGFGMRLAFDF